jgi:predicted molibdopterin-dependent oxidoreductase YjgC
LPDADMAEFYTSGRASNEAAFLYQLFAREYGTNNFPDCSKLDVECLCSRGKYQSPTSAKYLQSDLGGHVLQRYKLSAVPGR